MNISPDYLYQLAGEAVALYFHAAPEREVRLTPGAWLAISGEPLADFNIALIDQGPGAADHLHGFHHILQQRGLPALYFFSEGVADQLAAAAQTLGLSPAGSVPLMVCDGVPASPGIHPYHIERVGDAGALADVCQVVADAFGFPLPPVLRVQGERMLQAPGLAIYLAHCEDRPVATVTTVQAGPVVGVWAMATASTHQRQGTGHALLTHVMACHREEGAGAFYLWSTEAGKRLYDQVGFRTAAELAVWVSGHSTQVSSH